MLQYSLSTSTAVPYGAIIASLFERIVRSVASPVYQTEHDINDH